MFQLKTTVVPPLFTHKTSGVISPKGTQFSRLVTIDDKCDVKPLLQHGSTVPQHHRVEPRILLTNILNLQSMIEVHPHSLHLELWTFIYQLSIFIPGHTNTKHSYYGAE